MLLPITSTATAVDYGRSFRFDFGEDTHSISLDNRHILSDGGGMLFVTSDAVWMATTFVMKPDRRAYVDVGLGKIADKEPSWASCARVGAWKLIWQPYGEIVPLTLVEFKKPKQTSANRNL